MTRKISGLLALFGAMLASACGVVGEDKTPDYRYRLTVEVDTPDGLKAGSSVIEVRQSMGRSTMGGFNEQIFYKIRGEAVAVDLPDGQTLYALLRSPGGDVEWAVRVIPILAPDAGDDNHLDDVLLLEGKRELPRTWSPRGRSDERRAYPMMVTFGDEADPTSVTLVDPDDLAASFGEGVRLKHMIVELTDDPVTNGIEERLGWLPKVKGALVHLPVSDYPPPGTGLPLHNTLTKRNFKSNN